MGWSNEKFIREGADVTVAVGDPDSVKLYGYKNGYHFLLCEVNDEGAVLFDNGYQGLTMSDVGSSGIEFHDNEGRLKPGQKRTKEFADGTTVVITANNLNGITQNGLSAISLTDNTDRILYPY